MQNKFDELAKGLAQSVTRRQAVKKFGVGLAGMALACFGLAGKAEAGNKNGCRPPSWCDTSTNPCCCKCDGHKPGGTGLPTCAPNYAYCVSICAFDTGC